VKVYQCIRAYDLYIPAFEQKYAIKENNYSFNEIRDLLIKDGFAATYLLKPAFDRNEKNFFFTLWNYKTLQFKWAEENGLKTTNLDEIRLAQVEDFKPDVYYNFSPYYDNKITENILCKKDLVKVCWDAVIVQNPPFHEKYNLRLTLFEPYVKLWYGDSMDTMHSCYHLLFQIHGRILITIKKILTSSFTDSITNIFSQKEI
jgi:hypothetical protein